MRWPVGRTVWVTDGTALLLGVHRKSEASREEGSEPLAYWKAFSKS
jgi:hypothetical protein